MKNFLIALVAVAFAAVGCDKSAAPTQVTESDGSAFSKSSSSWTNQSFDMWNPCCNETVHFDSKVHYTIIETTDKDGITTQTIRINVAAAKATGQTSGIKYAMQENDVIINVNPGDCPSSQTYSVKFRATGTGSGQGANSCSFVYTHYFKLTTDDACNPSFEVLPTITLECE